MKLRVSAGALALLVSAPAFAFFQNVFKPDARAPVAATDAPVQMIGKLTLPGGGWCTASIVYRDLVVTAAHCVIDPEKKAVVAGAYTFYSGLVDNLYANVSRAVPIVWGTRKTKEKQSSDWAILRLEKPLGEKCGWMGVRNVELRGLFNQNALSLIAYSMDFKGGLTPSVDTGCALTGTGKGGVLLHNCSMSQGASGAPLYRFETDARGNPSYSILALNVAEHREGDSSMIGIPYDDDHANLAVPASAFLPALAKLMGRPN